MGIRHTLDVVSFFPPDGTNTEIGLRHLQSAELELGLTTTEPESGLPYPDISFTENRAEAITMSAMAIGSIVKHGGVVQPLCLGTTEGGGAHAVAGYQAQKSTCGVNGRTTLATHLRFRADKARMIVEQIEAAPTGNATARVRFVLLSVSGAPPSTVAYNVALPTATVAEEVYKLGPVKLGGSVLDADKIQSVSLDTGIQFEPLYGADLFPEEIDVQRSAPVLRIVTREALLFGAGKPAGATVVSSGTAVTKLNTFFSLRRRSVASRGLHAIADEEHVVVTMGGVAYIDSVAASSGADALTTVRVVGTGSPPLEVFTDVSIENYLL